MPSKLKSLELHGYKTFANRTFFGFGEMVTAIVGPNGSGKSNIADSIRWVLGEQSYSLLRGRKTEDMIFSGSESRSRAGMASATITFDNSDGWLPIDFSEVAVTRRAHRDGLNEYLINGQRVRLKDVSELLAESGLAERTYTVIGQGLVDAALSLKADERRRLFEEAAGIGLHRSRREETLRRLDATRRNLDRVEDILAELKPRLHSLERQARRAQEFDQVRQDLQVLLRDWYGFHWHEAQKDLAEAQQADHQQEVRLEKARRDLEQVEVRSSTLQAEIQALRTELNQWHRQLSEYHAQREQAIRRLVVVDERRRALLTQQENDQRDLARLQEELKFYAEQISTAEQEAAGLAAELEDAARQMESARAALQQRETERAEVEKRIQSLRQELGGLNARQGKLQAQQAENQAQESRLAESLQAAQAALERAEQELEQRREMHLSARRRAETAEKRRNDAEAGLKAHRGVIQEALKTLAQKRESQAALAAEQARIKAELDVIEQAEASLTGYADGTRRILQAARQNRLAGTRGTLNAFLETPAEYENAIAAALGDFLEAVLLENDPDAALDLLETESGRGVLLPVGALRSASIRIQPVKAGGGVIGEAADLVQTAPEYRPAVELLLRGVILVQDRAAARQVLQNQPDGVRAVTLRGDVFYASGPILSGKSGAGSGQTLLGRSRQQRDLQSAGARLRSQIQEAGLALAEQESKIEALRQEEERLIQADENARQEALGAARALESAKAAFDQAQRQVAWSQAQLQRLQEEREQRLAASKKILRELGQVEQDIHQTRSALREQNAALESLTLDELQAQHAHWVTRLAVGERALSDASSRLEERRQSSARAQAVLASLQDRLAGLEALEKELDQQAEQAHRDEAQIGAQIQALNVKIQPAETQLLDLEQKVAADQKATAAARQQVSMAEHLHAQTRIHLARRQESLQSLQRRIEDDFGLVAYEYVDQVSGPTPLPLMGMVEQLPIIQQLAPDIEENIKRQRAQLRRIGPVNPEAQAEYAEVQQRYTFLTEQVADLQQAEQDIRQAIAELDELMQTEFKKTFEAVADEFRQIFTRLFGGGSARLLLTDPDDLTNTGIEIEARLPGRRAQGLALLSGGERSLTATALVFALLRVSPTPFCVLDEVDAMLDEANVGRFRDLLRELSQQTQFIIVTHNRNTVQVADVIYGVTMGKDSSSQVLSLKLDEVGQVFD